MSTAVLYWHLNNKLNYPQQKKDKKRKDVNSGVEAITAALKAMPADQQVSTLLSKYAELAEDNRSLQVGEQAIMWCVKMNRKV